MLVNFFRPVIFPALMFVYLDKMSNLLENYVRTDTRYDKQEMLRNPNRGGSTFDFIIGENTYFLVSEPYFIKQC